MKPQEINDNNRLLAAFMGKTVYPDKIPTTKNKRGWKYSYDWHGEARDCHSFQLVYDTSWDALMPIVEKIERTGYYVAFDTKEAFIRNGVDFDITFISEESKIHAVWSACVEFVKHYNKITHDQTHP